MSNLGPQEKTLIINGAGAATTIIQASATPGTSRQRIFNVAGLLNSLSINNMTLRHGYCAGSCSEPGIENMSQAGGAIYNQAILSVDNVVFTANSTSGYDGGAIAKRGSLTVTNNTFSDNSTSSGQGAGIYNLGNLNIRNTIIANSSGAGDCYSDFGTVSANINNLIEDNTCSSLLSGNPNLGPLQDKGGPTPTMALLATPSLSVAIDAGDSGVCPPADQRGQGQRLRHRCL